MVYILGLYRFNGKESGKYCIYWGLYRDHGKENGNYCNIGGLYGGYIGVYIGIMEKKLETGFGG